MASTMGTARGSTQGSWRPRPARDDGLARVVVDGLLGLEQGSHRLEGHPKVNILPVADAALAAAAVVGAGANVSGFVGVKFVVVLTLPGSCVPAKPEPNSKPFTALMLSKRMAK